MQEQRVLYEPTRTQNADTQGIVSRLIDILRTDVKLRPTARDDAFTFAVPNQRTADVSTFKRIEGAARGTSYDISVRKLDDTLEGTLVARRHERAWTLIWIAMFTLLVFAGLQAAAWWMGLMPAPWADAGAGAGAGAGTGTGTGAGAAARPPPVPENLVL